MEGSSQKRKYFALIENLDMIYLNERNAFDDIVKVYDKPATFLIDYMSSYYFLIDAGSILKAEYPPIMDFIEKQGYKIDRENPTRYFNDDEMRGAFFRIYKINKLDSLSPFFKNQAILERHCQLFQEKRKLICKMLKDNQVSGIHDEFELTYALNQKIPIDEPPHVHIELDDGIYSFWMVCPPGKRNSERGFLFGLKLNLENFTYYNDDHTQTFIVIRKSGDEPEDFIKDFSKKFVGGEGIVKASARKVHKADAIEVIYRGGHVLYDLFPYTYLYIGKNFEKADLTDKVEAYKKRKLEML